MAIVNNTFLLSVVRITMYAQYQLSKTATVKKSFEILWKNEQNVFIQTIESKWYNNQNL